MDVETEIKKDMRSLGCSSEAKITLAYHLYMYIVEQKLMYDAEYCYNKNVDTLYVTARPSKSECTHVYVPISTSFDLTMDFISKLQNNLCTFHTETKLTIAFIEGDLTIVMYSFTNGLISRPSTEKITEQRNREARRTFINHELKKNHAAIIEEAMSGGLMEDSEVVG